jgi:hypothetical protein
VPLEHLSDYASFHLGSAWLHGARILKRTYVPLGDTTATILVLQAVEDRGLAATLTFVTIPCGEKVDEMYWSVPLHSSASLSDSILHSIRFQGQSLFH